MATANKFCEECAKKNNPTMCPGFWDYDSTKSLLKEDMTTCFQCGHKLIDTCFTFDESVIISHISTDTSFIEAMNKLKQDDIIEFNLKLSQMKNQVQTQESNNQQESSKSTNTMPTKDVIRCPKCNSTAITTDARGVNNFWGLLGASKTVNRCGNCGYTWKPNGR